MFDIGKIDASLFLGINLFFRSGPFCLTGTRCKEIRDYATLTQYGHRAVPWIEAFDIKCY
jgi:hypothetical protein